MPTINRVTLFDVPNEEDQSRILDLYGRMKKEALKDGKSYIQSVKAGRIIKDPRNQGFNLILQTTFASLEDMKFFDNECAFHAEAKKIVGPAMKPPPVIAYFTDAIEA